jgi:hypothetical protein
MDVTRRYKTGYSEDPGTRSSETKTEQPTTERRNMDLYKSSQPEASDLMSS